MFPLESNSDKAEWLYAIPDLACDDFSPLTEQYVKAALRLAEHERRYGTVVDDYEWTCEIAGLESFCPSRTDSTEGVSEEDLEYFEELLSDNGLVREETVESRFSPYPPLAVL